MCEDLHIHMLHLTVEKLWQNGACERYQAIVDPCSEKIRNKFEILLPVAPYSLANAKIHYKCGPAFHYLAFSRNPKALYFMTDCPPGVNGITITKIFA